MRTPGLALSLVISLLGCDDDGGQVDPGADATPEVDASPRPDAASGRVVGRLRIAEARVDGTYGWEAGVVDALLTEDGLPDWHVDVRREGPCLLRTYALGSCVDCNGICVAPSECRPYPTFLSGGDLTFEGLNGEVALRFESWAGYILDSAPFTDLFDAGATVRVRASGSAVFPGFTVEARGVTRLLHELAIDENTIVQVPDATDATFVWQAGDGDHVRIVLQSQTEAHGLPARGVLTCEGPDDGHLTIPGSLLADFPATQTAQICVAVDCPASSITRVSRGTAPVDAGIVELLLESSVEFFISKGVE